VRLAIVLAIVALAACGGTPTTKPIGTGGSGSATLPTADAVSWDKLEGPIQKVEIEVKDPKLRAELEKLFAGELGKPLERPRLRLVLDQIMRNVEVAELAVRGIQIAGGIQLVIVVTPQSKIRAITARDSAGKDIPLAGESNVPRVGKPLDTREVASLTIALRDRYRAEGFIAADASWGTRPAGPGVVDVLIEVAPGEQVIVTKLEMKGNTIPAAELVAAAGKFLVVGQPLAYEKIQRAVLAVADLYYDRGYPNVNVPTPAVSGPGKATITFTIEEGDRFKLGVVTVKGAEAKLAKRYLRLAALKKGDVFSRSAIRDAANRVRDAAREDGQQKAEVLPTTAVDLKAKTIAITLEISN
jgi:outer membrane protein insertion porin family